MSRMHDLDRHACVSASFLGVLSNRNLNNFQCEMLVRFLVLFSTVIMIAKLCQFICYFKLHLILVFDPAMIGVYALNDLITQISHDVAAGAVFVYWHHGVNEFQYFTMQDNDM